MQRWASIAVTSLLLMGAETLEAGFWDWIGWKEEVPMEPGVNQVDARVIPGQALQQRRDPEEGDSVGRRAAKPANEKRRTRHVQKEQPFPWEKQDHEDAPLPWQTPEQHQAPKEPVKRRQEKVQQRTVKKATTPITKEKNRQPVLCTPNQCLQPAGYCDNRYVQRPCVNTCSSLNNSSSCLRYGVFMPSCKTLFPEFLADPRAIILSAGWRYNDDCFANNMVDVSYGQAFPFYRWHNVFCCGDALQLDIQGALWALFDHLNESAPLVNADYYVGFPLTWACGRWQARLRGYHISSHIGDEYLLMNPNFDRRNPSAEYLDFFLAFKPNPDIRFYGGYGYILHRDNSFRVHHNYFEWGMETYMPMLRWNLWQDRVLGQPFFAMHFRGREEDHWQEDSTFVLGYEFKKYAGCGGCLRFFFQYHNGTSLEGQFSRYKTDYLSFRVSYAY